jgi:hypothetical protein
MVRRFINASTIQIYKKNSSAAAQGGKAQIPLWPTALPGGHAAA